MINRVTYIDLKWPGVEDIASTVRDWANIIYVEKRHQYEEDGIDFYTDKNLNKIDESNDLIVTRWGKSFDSSFHCITGYGLYEMLPWWRKMQDFFIDDLKLTPWLPYPCILMSESNLRRHQDKGRPTAFNYPIFGEEVTTNHIWHNYGDPDDQYNETYRYEVGKSIMIDTTYEHGGFVNPGFESTKTRAICNMGFAETYDVCLEKLLEAERSGLLEKIRDK